MDACPLNACLPYVADRIAEMSPNAKLIFMVRDPVEAVFSAEIMVRYFGSKWQRNMSIELVVASGDIVNRTFAVEKYWNGSRLVIHGRCRGSRSTICRVPRR
jgi:hypothetical protein